MKGEMEFSLFNSRRVDCFTSEYAIEVDFASKIFEGISQADYYAFMINRKAGLLLIVETKRDLETVREFHEYIIHRNVKYWIITPNDMVDSNYVPRDLNSLE